MALKIKLTRVGKKNDPKYRIIIAEARSKRDGRYIDQIGFYDPLPEEHVLNVDEAKLKDWIHKGATFTKGTERLLHKFAR
jgi:small subunit ribosomal protein S16